MTTPQHRQNSDHPLLAALARHNCRYMGSMPCTKAGITGTLSAYLARTGFVLVVDYKPLRGEKEKGTAGWEVFIPASRSNKIANTLEALESFLLAERSDELASADDIVVELPDDVPDYEAIGVIAYCSDQHRECQMVDSKRIPPPFLTMGWCGDQWRMDAMLRTMYANANTATRAMLDDGQTVMMEPSFVELLTGACQTI